MMPTNSSSQPIVLVIDPDPLTMTGVAAALHLSGYESHCARDAEAAMKAANELELDLVICDINVEGASGIELYREIQKTEANAEVPVMFVSSKQMPDIIRRTHEAGGVYYLRKPFDPEVLLALVDKALWMPHLVRNRMTTINEGQSISPPHTAISGVHANGSILPHSQNSLS